MAKKRDSFAALMSLAQDQQGFFTTKQAIEAGYADNTHPYHVRAGNWERIWRGIYRLRHYPSPEDGDKVAWYLWSRGRDEKPMDERRPRQATAREIIITGCDRLIEAGHGLMQLGADSTDQPVAEAWQLAQCHGRARLHASVGLRQRQQDNGAFPHSW